MPPTIDPIGPTETTGNPTANPSDGIVWITNWSDALGKAKTENRPIMINFYTDVCPWCKRLDSDTFGNPETAAFLNENFVTAKSNSGKSVLYRNYGISGVPTTVFTTPDGKEIGRVTGYQSPGQFRDSAQGILNKWDSLKN